MSLPSWIMAGWTSDISARPRTVHVDGTALVTYRDAADVPRVVPMHCPHRGASLVRGRVEGPCLVCPYHGREVSPLGVDRVDVQDGIVWIKTCDNDQDVIAPPPRLPEWDDPAYTTFEYTRRVESAVDAMVENTLDWHHVDHVHSTSLARGVAPAMTFSSHGHGHGRVVYTYADGFSVINEFWAPYTSVIRFVVDEDGCHGRTDVMILWMSAAPADDERHVSLHIRVSRNFSRWMPNALFRLMNDFVLGEDRVVVRDIPANFKGTLEDGGTDAFIQMYRRSLMIAVAPPQDGDDEHGGRDRENSKRQ